MSVVVKVKIINGHWIDGLEVAINDFIKDKKIIDIKFDVYGDKLSSIKYAMVIYEEEIKHLYRCSYCRTLSNDKLAKCDVCGCGCEVKREIR